MEGQKTIIFAYNVGPHNLSKILGNGNDYIEKFDDFLSWSKSINGRLLLAFVEYLKHAKKLNRWIYILYDQAEFFFFPMAYWKYQYRK